MKAYTRPDFSSLMHQYQRCWLILLAGFFYPHCQGKELGYTPGAEKMPVIFDTDTNNELDDQHALAYLLFNGNTFEVQGITVNATIGGGEIEEHYDEALRIVKLCGLEGKIPVLRGANGNFTDIEPRMDNPQFDGCEAVNYIIRKAKESVGRKLTIVAVGKLTNVALALLKEPSIAETIRVVWLGSNYPEAGEYNLKADIPAMNFVLNTRVSFEMVVVRYSKASGSDAVRVTRDEIESKMPGKGPLIPEGIPGRHEGISIFTTFGDYSVELFRHINYKTDPPSRALFDLVAVAILKNPEWGESTRIAAPLYGEEQWVERNDHPRKIKVWDRFKKDRIIEDFFKTMNSHHLVDETD